MKQQMNSTPANESVGRAPARQGSSQPDAPSPSVRHPSYAWARHWLHGRRARHTIPERKQLNRYQAYLVARSLCPFEWRNPNRRVGSARPVHARTGR